MAIEVSPPFLPRAIALWLLALIVALLLALPPLLWGLGLPVRIELLGMAEQYFGGNTLQAVVALFFFYLIQTPRFVAGSARRILLDPRRLGLFAALAIFLWWRAGGHTGIFLGWLVIAFTVLALYEQPPQGMSMERVGVQLAFPAIYFFLGLLAVFSYTSVIAVTRPFWRMDASLLQVDRFLLLGSTVTGISHEVLSWPPAGAILESVYYGLFPVIGAALIWLALEGKQGSAIQYVVDLLTAYLITLGIYWIAPSVGPFFFDTTTAPELATRGFQIASLQWLRLVTSHRELFSIGANYFIAFPAMHIAQSAIIAWHLRPWPRLFRFIVGFNVLLAAAMIGLQWHYAIDLPGGLAVAFLAVKFTSWTNHARKTQGPSPEKW